MLTPEWITGSNWDVLYTCLYPFPSSFPLFVPLTTDYVDHLKPYSFVLLSSISCSPTDFPLLSSIPDSIPRTSFPYLRLYLTILMDWSTRRCGNIVFVYSSVFIWFDLWNFSRTWSISHLFSVSHCIWALIFLSTILEWSLFPCITVPNRAGTSVCVTLRHYLPNLAF